MFANPEGLERNESTSSCPPSNALRANEIAEPQAKASEVLK